MNLQRLTKAECAELLCVDIRSVTNYLEKGIPKHRAKGELYFVWSEVFAWREQTIRDDVRAMRAAAGSDDAKTEMAELRLRALRAEAEKAELELAEKRGELVPLAWVKAEFSRIAYALRARLLSVPSAWAGRLGGCATVVDRQLMLTEGVNELLPLCGEAVNSDDMAAAAAT